MGAIQDQIRTEEVMRKFARFIDSTLKKMFGKKLGFMILVFEFGKPGVANYISNASRDTMIEVLREKAKVLEEKLDIPPVNLPTQ